MAVRGTCNGVDVIVKLDGTNRHLMVLKLEGGDLVERSGATAGQPVLDGTRLRVGTSMVEIAEDQLPTMRQLLDKVRTTPASGLSMRGEGMRRAARRIQTAGVVMVFVALLSGLVVLAVGASGEDSGGVALLSALLTWALGLPIAIAVYSIGEYLDLMAEDR
jgi:hypothetical protein